jgi:Zn-dependent protease with chaperone function
MLATREGRRLLAYLFAIPVLAYLALSLIQDHRRSVWTGMVGKALPWLSYEEVFQRGLPILCAGRDAYKAPEGACAAEEWLSGLRLLAVVTVAVAIAFLVAVRCAGRRCRRKPELLIRVFRRGSHIMTGATLFFLAAQALLLGAMLCFLAADLSGSFEFLVSLAFLTSLAALAALYRILRLLITFNEEFAFETGDGRVLSREQAPDLWNLAIATAKAIGTEPPDNIVGCPEANFYASEGRVFIGGQPATGRILIVSIPLCHVMTVPEYHSIIAHEMAHFHTRDAELSRRFYAPYRKGAETLETMIASARSSGPGGHVLLPAISLLSFYLQSFQEAEADLSRERELAADALAASVTSRRDTALGLLKATSHDHAWDAAYAELLESESADRESLLTPSELFQKAAEHQFQGEDRTERIKQLEEERLEHLTDSHPPLHARLAALGFTVEELYDFTPNIRPAEPASVLIPNARELERALLPAYAPKSETIRSIFRHRQTGFAAIEYYALILNRSFLVFASKEGLYGLKFCSSISAHDPRYYERPSQTLDDPWFTPGNPAFHDAMKESRDNFFLPGNEIADVEFDPTPRWGMGAIPHAGKLRVRLVGGRTREFVVLGEADGDGIRRVILERIGCA